MIGGFKMPTAFAAARMAGKSIVAATRRRM